MPHLGQQVAARLARIGRVIRLQFEPLARIEADAAALTGYQRMMRLLGLHPQPGQTLAFFCAGVAPREVEDLEPAERGRAEHSGNVGAQVLRRHLEIVVFERPLARPHGEILLDPLDLAEVPAVCQGDPALVAIGCRPAIVGHDQRVLICGMFEPVADPDMLHQAGHEIERAFPVLHAEHQLRVAAEQAKAVIRQAVLVEHAADDVRDALVLEDAAIDAAGQEPHPGHHLRLPDAVAARVYAHAFEVADVAMQRTPLGCGGVAEP